MNCRLWIGAMLVAISAADRAAGRDDLKDFFDNSLPKKAADTLAGAEEVELLSLDPSAGWAKEGEAGFHRWKVLGSTTVKDGAGRKKVVGTVVDGLPKS